MQVRFLLVEISVYIRGNPRIHQLPQLVDAGITDPSQMEQMVMDNPEVDRFEDEDDSC